MSVVSTIFNKDSLFNHYPPLATRSLSNSLPLSERIIKKPIPPSRNISGPASQRSDFNSGQLSFNGVSTPSSAFNSSSKYMDRHSGSHRSNSFSHRNPSSSSSHPQPAPLSSTRYPNYPPPPSLSSLPIPPSSLYLSTPSTSHYPPSNYQPHHYPSLSKDSPSQTYGREIGSSLLVPSSHASMKSFSRKRTSDTNHSRPSGVRPRGTGRRIEGSHSPHPSILSSHRLTPAASTAISRSTPGRNSGPKYRGSYK